MAPTPFLAWITPVDTGASPEHPIAPGGPPPGVNVPTFPTPLPMPGGRPGPVDPGYGVPGGAHVSPPIYHPGHPDHGLPSTPGTPTHPIAPSPGVPTHPIAPPPPQVGHPIEPGGPILGENDLLLLLYVPGHGFKWILIDTDLMPSHPIVKPQPPAPTHPIQPQPPTGGVPPAPTHPIQPPPAPTQPVPPPTAAPKA